MTRPAACQRRDAVVDRSQTHLLLDRCKDRGHRLLVVREEVWAGLLAHPRALQLIQHGGHIREPVVSVVLVLCRSRRHLQSCNVQSALLDEKSSFSFSSFTILLFRQSGIKAVLELQNALVDQRGQLPRVRRLGRGEQHGRRQETLAPGQLQVGGSGRVP